MLVPLSWLKEYISTKSPPEKIAEKLLLSGTKVEEIREVGTQTVFEFEITPNRADTLSIFGIARELAAIEQHEVRPPETDFLLPPKESSHKVDFSVKNKKLCPSYSLVRLNNVEIGTSPGWLKEYLTLAGTRPINNVVDITNFVMLELGQPMHAFDANKVKGGLALRGAKAGETIITLDGIARKLPEGAIVIEDEERIIDLCGLMGGKNSEVESKTNSLLLLVPIYDPQTIRRTSISTNLRTEASNRFEKNLDPNAHLFALNRAVKLLSELANATIASQVGTTPKVPDKVVSLDKNLIKKVIGIDLKEEVVIDLLSAASFIVHNSKIKDDCFDIQVPSFRTDVDIAQDILEEIARLYGYNNLPRTLPIGEIPAKFQNFEADIEASIRDILLKLGFNESTGYTLVSRTDCENFGYSPEKSLKVKNPLSSEFEYLRPTLLINSLKAIKANSNRQNIGFFEIAKTFEKEIDKINRLPKQPLKLSLVSNESLEVFKGKTNELWLQSGIEITETKGQGNVIFDKVLSLNFQGREVGLMGEFSENLLTKYDMPKSAIFALEINFVIFQEQIQASYKPLPKYPSVKEDISFYLNSEHLIKEIIDAISSVDKLVSKVTLTDMFDSPKGRSATIAVEYFDPERTLESKEVEGVRNKIYKVLESRFNSNVRKG